MLCTIFNMRENFEKLEGCEFDIDHRDYFMAINKDTIKWILEWTDVKMNLYLKSCNIWLNEMTESMRKELIISILSDEDRRKEMSETVFKDSWKYSDKIRLNISEHLLNNLQNFKWTSFWDAYEYRYNVWWDKINFYVHDSYWKRRLKHDIEFLDELFDEKFATKGK